MKKLNIIDSLILPQEDLERLEVSKYVSYSMYCGIFDNLIENKQSTSIFYLSHLQHQSGILDEVKKFGLVKQLTKIFKEFSQEISSIKESFGIGWKELAKAFKNRDVFTILKSFGFNLKLMLKAINSASKLLRSGLLSVFEEIHKTGAWKKIQEGTMKVDELLNKYPILKKVGGVVLAGLLLYIWLNMTFIGDFDFDMDLSTIALALKGVFSITELFTSPSGMMMLSLFAMGFMGISFPWLGSSVRNLLMAILYTGFKKIKELEFAKKLKQRMELKKV